MIFGKDMSTLRKLMLLKAATGVPLNEYEAIGNPLTFETNKAKPLRKLLLSWTPEQLEYLRDAAYWTQTVSQCRGADVLTVSEMESNEEVWADWLKQENEYAVNDRKSMEAGGGKYLNFIKIILRKHSIPLC